MLNGLSTILSKVFGLPQCLCGGAASAALADGDAMVGKNQLTRYGKCAERMYPIDRAYYGAIPVFCPERCLLTAMTKKNTSWCNTLEGTNK